MKYTELLIQGAESLGIKLSDDQVSKFGIYLKEIRVWSGKINLTSIKDEKGLIINHFLDSLSIKKYIRSNSTLLDIGSGAGFPGVPLGIVDETLDVTVVDSVEKKMFFVKNLLRDIKLKNVKALKARADDKANGLTRGTYDYVVTRAVSDIGGCLALSGEYVSNSGFIILMRGKDGIGEWNKSDRGITSGYILDITDHVKIPFSNAVRTNLFVKKKI